MRYARISSESQKLCKNSGDLQISSMFKKSGYLFDVPFLCKEERSKVKTEYVYDIIFSIIIRYSLNGLCLKIHKNFTMSP